MDRRDRAGPDDRHPPDDDSGGSANRGNPGDKIRERPDCGSLAGYCGMGKGEAEMSDKVTEAFNEDPEGWKKRAEALATALETAAQRMTVDRSHLTEERDTAEQQLAMALTEIRAQVAANRVIIEERDAAEKERTESRAEVVRLRAENEGLAADLLRITAERDTDRLDLAQVRYERDTALAASKEQQTANAALWEAQQAHQRKADHDQVIIEGLREALERTERLLATAKARQIPPALVGLLGVIRREAAAAEKMIL